MQQANEKKRSKKLMLCIFLIVVLCIAIGGGMFYLISTGRLSLKNSGKDGLAYEANVITEDEDALQDAVDALYKQAKEGQMVLQMQTQASSVDGLNFTCSLANAKENRYDMFMVLYLDETQEEIYRSGLIPLGGKIVEFTTTKQLEPGNYEATLVFNQVEEDRETIHAQVNVGLQLIVK